MNEKLERWRSEMNFTYVVCIRKGKKKKVVRVVRQGSVKVTSTVATMVL